MPVKIYNAKPKTQKVTVFIDGRHLLATSVTITEGCSLSKRERELFTDAVEIRVTTK